MVDSGDALALVGVVAKLSTPSFLGASVVLVALAFLGAMAVVARSPGSAASSVRAGGRDVAVAVVIALDRGAVIVDEGLARLDLGERAPSSRSAKTTPPLAAASNSVPAITLVAMATAVALDATAIFAAPAPVCAAPEDPAAFAALAVR